MRQMRRIFRLELRFQSRGEQTPMDAIPQTLSRLQSASRRPLSSKPNVNAARDIHPKDLATDAKIYQQAFCWQRILSRKLPLLSAAGKRAHAHTVTALACS